MAPNGRIWVVDSNQPRKSEFFRLAKIMLGILIPKNKQSLGSMTYYAWPFKSLTFITFSEFGIRTALIVANLRESENLVLSLASWKTMNTKWNQ